MPRNSRLVYSTELGRTCPTCRRSVHECRCQDDASRPAGDGNVRVGRESKGRGGKVVTLITGLAVPRGELQEIATRLKKRCGTGGTVKDTVIEIQGDHREAVLAWLTAAGHRAKLIGG